MILKNKRVGLFLLIVIYLTVYGKDDTTLPKDSLIVKDKKGKGLIILPLIYHSPETGWAVGSRLGKYSKDNKSNVFANLFLSQKLQFEIYFGGEVYEKEWKIIPKLKWSRWVDPYYGLGNETKDKSKVTYEERFFWSYVSVQRNFGELFIGTEIETRIEKMYDSIPQNPYGGRDWYIAGLGSRITHDTRNNVFYPSKGHFYEASVRYYLPIKNGLEFSRLILDYREYFNFFHVKDIIFAFQMKADLTIGQVPIQIIPAVGDIVRGYDQTRYKDFKVLYGQFESRYPIWKKISGTLFLGCGDVFETFNDISKKDIKIAGGIGLRYRVNDNKINLRLDFAINRDKEFSFYFNIGEAF